MSTPNSTQHHKITSFKGKENFMIWKIQIHNILFELELEDWIDDAAIATQQDRITAAAVAAAGSAGTASTLPAPISDADWKKKDRRALVNIQNRVEEGPLQLIMSETTAIGAWHKLAQMYESQGATGMVVLRQRFFTTRMAEGENFDDHIRNLRSFYEQINISAKSGRAGRGLDEADWIATLTASLPESWQSVVASISYDYEEGGTPAATLTNLLVMVENAFNRLVSEWNRRQNGSGDSGFFVRNNNRSSNNRGSSSGRKPVSQMSPAEKAKLTCHNCGKQGHIKPECHSLPQNKANYTSTPPNFAKASKSGNRSHGKKNKGKNAHRTNNAQDSVPQEEYGCMGIEIANAAAITPDMWIYDSGTTTHICNDKSLFEQFTPSSETVKGVSGHATTIQGRGTILFHVPPRM
jgi:hypothetical protein